MRALWLVFPLLLLVGCAPRSGGPETPVITLRNDSPVTLRHIVVRFPGKTVRYGDLRPGESSAAQPVPQAYRYAWMEAESRGGKSAYLPFDYVGEAPLQPGFYIYVLTTPETPARSRPVLPLEITLERH
ncbi:hypothetical protein V3W47_07410 [Deinococcus sp. YIM 134068]|uniref:hypothetical protein n=1 Tax=Deinococcus lichenicola TaxID=3118910 RepID=UPI002F94F025